MYVGEGGGPHYLPGGCVDVVERTRENLNYIIYPGYISEFDFSPE